MADCFSLENTDELLERLNNRARNCATDKALIYYDYDAIDIIEQLLSENAKLKERCELLQGNNVLLRGCVDKYNIDEIERLREENTKLKAERDALMKDLKEFSDCDQCKHNTDENLENGFCKDCSVIHNTKYRWEWRGVQNDPI